MTKFKLIITHESCATLKEVFHIVERLIEDFVWWKLVLVITMTTKKESKKEKTMAIKHGKAKGGQKGGQYGLP
jgi:hypothetical protein